MRTEKRELLLEKATELFLKNGYEGTSMRDIAKAVGIQAPGIYHYFKSKKAILTEIDEQSWQLFQREVLKYVEKVSDPEEKIKMYVQRMLSFAFLLGTRLNILDSSISRKHAKFRKSKDREVFNVIRDTLITLSEKKDLPPHIDPTLGAFSLYNLVASTHKWYNPKGRLDPDTLADQITRLFLYGYYGR
ncbi:MAG: TetR/AcrR family transcriptional regulator [Deltaproteobacteria bacterium]|nr:TetR/AcrR family transcriptional regulator [Deltaproteobacteria bacterium]